MPETKEGYVPWKITAQFLMLDKKNKTETTTTTKNPKDLNMAKNLHKIEADDIPRGHLHSIHCIYTKQ